jgi:hypothetical protein
MDKLIDVKTTRELVRPPKRVLQAMVGAAGLTQIQFAALIGRHHTHVSKVFNGARTEWYVIEQAMKLRPLDEVHAWLIKGDR